MLRTIPESFYDVADRRSDKTALLHKEDGIWFQVNFKELRRRVRVFASALQEIGVKKGDRIAILSENRVEWAVSDLAVMSLGAIVVPLHSTFSTNALCAVLNHSETSVLIVSNQDFLDRVLAAKENLKYLKTLIILDGLGEKPDFNGRTLSFEEIFRSNEELRTTPQLNEDEVCSIIYTSGTTGDPKGVLLTHKNILSNVEAVTSAVPVKDGDLFLSFLPLSHIFERTIGYYTPLFCGGAIAYAEGTKQLPKNLKEVKPTILISVPRIFEKFQDAIWDNVNNSSAFKKKLFRWALKQQKGTSGYKIADALVFKKIRANLGGRLRLAVSGGASLDDNIGKFFSKVGVTILEGYGLTETSPVISANRERSIKFGTVGKVLSGVEVKIGDSKEILVKGPNVTKGYFKNPEETSKALSEGWFHTGDLGFIDSDGFLTIVGRGKEMIVTSGGKNVWPEPIENLINNDRFIAQSMVIGNRRKFISALIVPDWQEIVKYLKESNIPLDEPSKLATQKIVIDLLSQRINDKINPNLSEVEKIKKFVVVAEEFSSDRDEMTPTLKLRRHIIEKHYEKQIDALYA